MPDYSKGKIYALRAPGTVEVYVGSATIPLSTRMAHHRNDYKLYKEGTRHYITSYKLLEQEGCYIELIEDYPCENKEQLNKREGEIIRATENCVNKYIAGRTHKEYYVENRQQFLDNRKQYREENKEYINQYNQEKIVCECGAYYARGHKTRHQLSKKHQTLIAKDIQPSRAI